MVIQLGEGNVNDSITRAPHFQTQIHIAECDRQLFLIKSPHLIEYFAPGQQTRTGDRAVVARRLQLAANARRVSRQTAKRMLGDPADAHDDAGVLDGVVRIQESRADRANLRTLHMLSHHCKPFPINYFGIVIEEEQPRTFGLLHGEVIDGRKIKGPAVTQEPCA